MIEIADNIFAFINDNGAANSGFILVNDAVIVIDTTFFPSKAVEILKDIKTLTHRKIKYVINTHYHANHVFGNSVFKGADFIASELTFNFLNEVKNNFANVYKAKYPDLSEELDKVKVTLPTITYKRSKTLKFKNKTIKIFKVGGHSPDSYIVQVLPDNVVFAGDLLYCNLHPHITSDSDITQWKSALLKIKDLNPKIIVPGHGNLCGIDEIDSTIEYFDTLEEKIKEILDGENAEIMYDLEENEIFSKRGFEELFIDNVKFFIKKLV
jgi:cyclase